MTMEHEKNRNAPVTVQTPTGPREIPHWAQCYCVSQHRPAYAHPYPFMFPTMVELWFCPNTYHQMITLRKMYRTLKGPPSSEDLKPFSLFVRSAMEYYWTCLLRDPVKDKRFFEQQPEQDSNGESDELLTEYIREVATHG